MKTANVLRRGHQQNDYRQEFETPQHSHLEMDPSGDFRAFPFMGAFTAFPLLPKATVDAASDKLFTVGGSSPVIARAAAGGVNFKTKSATPADGDVASLAVVATTGMVVPITAVSQPIFQTRVALSGTAFAKMFGSFGLNENSSDVDPTGTAGDGAMFLYDPTEEVTTGLTTAQHSNWILAHKVDGADTFDATTIEVVTGTDYELEIRLNADLKPEYYINGTKVGTGPALTKDDSIGAFLGIELAATPGGQGAFDARYVRVARNIG